MFTTIPSFSLILICVFLFGLCIGSFLNVVIYRFNTGLSIAKGRSRCGSCGKTLHWYELIPLASYLFQKGRCRACRARLSLQYPLVELLTGLLFAAVVCRVLLDVMASSGGIFLYGALALIVYYFIQWAILIVIFVYDLRHKIIPDSLAFLFAGLALVKILVVAPSLWAFFAGPIVALPLFAIWALSKGKWMGFGDVKLALGIGWFLGISSGFAALMLGFWIGAIVGVGIILFQRGRGLTMKSEIPFAPFLIVGIALAYFFHIDFLGLMGMVSFM